MARLLYFLGRVSARHHWLMIGAWLLLTVVLLMTARVVGTQTSDDLTLPGTQSTAAKNLLEKTLPKQAYGSNPLVFEAGHGTLTDSSNKNAVDATVANVKKVDGVTSAINPLSSQGSAFLSSDKRIGYIPVTLDISPSNLTADQAQQVLDAAAPARAAGMRVAVSGYVGQQLSKPATESSEVYGLSAAVIILLLTFGTATAMALPLITAVLGLACTLSIIALLGHLFAVPSVGPTLATMIGLGVGIDYSLFIVTRHRLQLRAGMEVRESVARATATAGGAVLFAGGTVVVALCALAVAGIPLVRNMGFAAAVAVVVAVLAAITLLPALLGALGLKINALRVPMGRHHPDDTEPHGWARWARGVAARPIPAATAALVVLLVLAIPLLNLRLGQSDDSELPGNTTSHQSYELLRTGFGPGSTGPLLVSVRLGTPAKPDQKNLNAINKQEQQLQATQKQIEDQALAAGATQAQAQAQAQQQTQKQSQQLAAKKKQAEAPQTDPRLTTLQNDIKHASGVKSVSPISLDSQNTAGVFNVVPDAAPDSQRTSGLVDRLRASVIPGAVSGTDVTADVGGQTAAYIDLATRISSKLPLMIAVVVGLSFILLLIAFRSLLVPLKAAVMNLISVAAAYGVVTFLFQEGHGASLIGLHGPVPIVSFVPLMMFAILFGLSMDYEVFLLSQMQDHYKQDGDPTKAVVDGLANTGRVITSAALIMVCVFSSFVLNGNATVKQFGVGLSMAIAVDATLVRCLLVPAVMVLLGRRAWWLPGWLDRWVPHLSIEGEEYFRKRDAEHVPPTPPPTPTPTSVP